MSKHKIPTIEELKSGEVEQTELRKLLEQSPPEEWLKPHIETFNRNGKPVFYLPIERVDFLLRSIFPSSWFEVLNVGIYQHSVQVTGRLFYVNPSNNRVEHSDGVGGSTTAQGFEAAVGIAESNAKKSAAKKLGKIFGRDLSRELGEPEKEPEKEEVEEEKDLGNPVKKRIIKQIKVTKTKAGFQRINVNVLNAIKEGELDESDVDEITQCLTQRMEFINLKSIK